MKTIEQTVTLLEDVLSTLSRKGYADIIAAVTEDRAEESPAEEELALTGASVSTLGIRDIMVSLKQDRYDALIAAVEARRTGR